jgi:hypothetical protein
MMRRLAFLITALFVATMSMAVEISQLRELGLPANAVPTTLYFDNMYSDASRDMSAQDLAESTLIGLDNEYIFFVEQLPSSADDLYACINLWMYDTEKNTLEKIFSQQREEYKELLVMGVAYLLDKQSSFKDVVVSDTKQKISVQQFTSHPVVVLKTEVFTGFSHSPQKTLLIYPDSKTVKVLDNQMFVCISHTLTNVLMAAEMDFAQDYIITTSTAIRSEKQPLKESEEYIIYNKQYLYPSLYIYSARGKEVGNITLPVDEIDMLR